MAAVHCAPHYSLYIVLKSFLWTLKGPQKTFRITIFNDIERESAKWHFAAKIIAKRQPSKQLVSKQ